MVAGGLNRTGVCLAERARGPVEEHASLREDYLNQVQRDFLSRDFYSPNTPSGTLRRLGGSG